MLSDEEIVVRALHSPFWDADAKRATPKAFKVVNVSVSRKAILSFDEIIQIFRRDLERTNPATGVVRKVEGAAMVAVSAVNACVITDKAPTYSVITVADPIEAAPLIEPNPAHALIQTRRLSDPERLCEMTTGMANSILKACEIRPL